MGPSMSNPDRFKQLNRQRRIQAYQKKLRTQFVSLDSKIKIKNIADLTSKEKRETSQPKTFMVREQKSVENQLIPPKFQIYAGQGKQRFQEKQETPKRDSLNQQNNVRFLLPNEVSLERAHYKSTNFLNSGSKNSSTRKIILNNQTYEIDIEKMKNRKIRSKERYTKSILTSPKISSKINGFSTKQLTSTNSVGNGISTLELQSQLSPFADQNHTTQTQFHDQYKLRNNFRQAYGKIMESRKVENNEKQKVKGQYFDEYLGNFESIKSFEYQKKVSKSISERKFLKAKKVSKTQKILEKVQGPVSEYEMRSENRIKQRKSQNTASSYKSLAFNQPSIAQSQTEVKKTVKIVKVQKLQQSLSKAKLLQ